MVPYISVAIVAGFLQIATIYFLKTNFLGRFLYVIPVILVYQFLFLWNYSKAPNFIIIWFVTIALTGTLAFLVGHFLYQEHVSLLNLFGIGFIMVGIVFLNLT